MIRRPPISTRTDTLFPYTTLFRSELLLLDADDQETMSRPNAPDASAWCIHGAIHRAKPAARVLLHCHPPYATALATLKDPAMKPIDQNTARFFDLVSYDLGFGGIADDKIGRASCRERVCQYV